MRWGGRSGAVWVALLVGGLGACDEKSPTPHKDVTSPATATATAAATAVTSCEAYCTKMKECFPKAVDSEVATTWSGQCAADCKRDLEVGGHFAELTTAAAACTESACGVPFGECLDRKLATMKVSVEDHRYLDLHPWCTLSHACFVAELYGYIDPAARDRMRSELLLTRNALYDNTRRAGINADIGCRMLVETQCSSPSPLPRQGPPIDVDCEAFCNKAKTCRPDATSGTWLANCRTSCRMEAAAGTTYAAFYAAVAACSDVACTDALGRCIADEVADRWPDGVDDAWDMRKLDASCQIVRLCHEVALNAGDPLTSRMSRRGQFRFYGTRNDDLTPTECANMRKSLVLSSSCF